MDLSTLPFKIGKKQIWSVFIPLIPVIFLLLATTCVSENKTFDTLMGNADHYFGGIIYLSTSDLTEYDKIGGDGLIPIMRLGGITKGIKIEDMGKNYEEIVGLEFGENILKAIIVFISLFLGYLCYAIISRTVYEFKSGKEKSAGLRGINLSTIGLSLLAAGVIMFISSFSLQGFQLVMLLNFCVIFALAIPQAAAGEPIGESIYKSFDFIRFNLSGVVRVYLLSMGVAVLAPIGLLLIFAFPLSVLSAGVLNVVKLALLSLGITFALFYQFVVCSRASLDFTRKVETRVPSLETRLGKRVK